MSTNTCNRCRFWKEELGSKWGLCTRIIDSNDLECDSEELAAMGVLAMTYDSESYNSWITTRENFGCVMFQPVQILSSADSFQYGGVDISHPGRGFNE